MQRQFIVKKTLKTVYCPNDRHIAPITDRASFLIKYSVIVGWDGSLHGFHQTGHASVLKLYGQMHKQIINSLHQAEKGQHD